MPVMAQKL